MKRFIIMSLVLLGCLQVAQAQNTIESIRQAYQAQKQVIAQMSDDFPAEGCPPEYYHLHVVQNLPGTGPHHENIRMYYAEVPSEEDVIYPPHYLTFVSSKYNFAAREFYEEFLYDDKGQVIFIYARTPDVDFPKIHELRLYFDGERLLRLNVKEEGKDVYTGTTVPEQYAEFCSQYKARASRFLEEFKSIDDNTYL